MESIERHLSGWFADRLGGNRAHHFTWVYEGVPEASLNFADQPVEALSSKTLLENNVFGAEHLT